MHDGHFIVVQAGRVLPGSRRGLDWVGAPRRPGGCAVPCGGILQDAVRRKIGHIPPLTILLFSRWSVASNPNFRVRGIPAIAIGSALRAGNVPVWWRRWRDGCWIVAKFPSWDVTGQSGGWLTGQIGARHLRWSAWRDLGTVRECGPLGGTRDPAFSRFLASSGAEASGCGRRGLGRLKRRRRRTRHAVHSRRLAVTTCGGYGPRRETAALGDGH